jgi:hypothetical protein
LEIKRLQDWPTRLSLFLQAQAHVPFDYGTNDCCLFVADAVLAMTGHDFAADHFRGKYNSEVGAYRVLKKFGGGSVAAMMDKFVALGYFEEVLPAFAGRGDVVLVVIDGVDSLGIVDLTGIHIIATAPTGSVRLPIALATRGWKLWPQ